MLVRPTSSSLRQYGAWAASSASASAHRARGVYLDTRVA